MNITNLTKLKKTSFNKEKKKQRVSQCMQLISLDLKSVD